MEDVVVKKVDVLDLSTGTPRTITQFLVKIGRTTLSRHSDEASAIIAQDAANNARKQAVARLRNNG